MRRLSVQIRVFRRHVAALKERLEKITGNPNYAERRSLKNLSGTRLDLEVALHRATETIRAAELEEPARAIASGEARP